MSTLNPRDSYPAGFLDACEAIGVDPDTEEARHSLAVWDAVPDVAHDDIALHVDHLVTCVDCSRSYLSSLGEPFGRCDACYSRSVASGADYMLHGGVIA